MKYQNDFEQFLFVKKGLAPVTVAGHIGTIIRNKDVLGEHPSHETIERFVAALYRSEYSYHYKVNTVVAIEYYLEFLGNPLKLARQRKPKPIVKEVLTEGEVTAMFLACRSIREKAMLAVLAYSGIRNKEFRQLKVSDIDTGNNAIRIVRGKGEKDGWSYVSAECVRLINRYLMQHPRGENDLLFTTLERNNPFTGGDVRKWVRIWAKRAGLQKRVYPYILRHSLATNMIYRGADIWAVKGQLRHAWVESTMVYIHSIGFGERKTYDKYAPSYI